MFTASFISVMLFQKAGKTRSFFPRRKGSNLTSMGTVDKLEQSFFATGYM
ncbi:MAG: hypothetical protein H8E32_08750 [Nitrospinae bacterium]|nr:hypothetical protein [Nitrospinota bacterium]